MIKAEIARLILDRFPIGVAVFDAGINVIYRNKKADLFQKSYQWPEEVPSVSKRIFDAISSSRLAELFPGEIYIKKRPEGAETDWTFKLEIVTEPSPLVFVYIVQDSVSMRLEINKLRIEFRLTRRESDVLRRVIDGLRNSEISDDLAITEQTVKDHLSNIYEKLGVENRFDLIRMLINSPET
jgi:DNA-binding CsgD family transcriptional regulator